MSNEKKKKFRTDSECSFDDGEGEDLDPRVQNELEKLNAATDGINHLETELSEAQTLFSQMMADAAAQLKIMHQKLGKCVDKSRPYYDALKNAKAARTQLHDASLAYEIAQTKHFNAKKRVVEVEKKACEAIDGRLDPELQEMMNQVTTEVMDTAVQYDEAEKKHCIVNADFNQKHILLQEIYDKLKSQVTKSRPFFELKSNLNKNLEVQKQRVEKIQEGIHLSKQAYSETLHELQVISDDIHKTRTLRRQLKGSDGSGVGGVGNSLSPPQERSENSEIEGVMRNISIDDHSEISLDYDTRSLDSNASDDVWSSKLTVDDTQSLTESQNIEYNLLQSEASLDNNNKTYSQTNLDDKNLYENKKNDIKTDNRNNNALNEEQEKINLVIQVSDAMEEIQESLSTSPYDCITSHSIDYSLPSHFNPDIIDGSKKKKDITKSRSFTDLLKENLLNPIARANAHDLTKDRSSSLPNILDQKNQPVVDKISIKSDEITI